MTDRVTTEDIAIVGMGLVVPGADTQEAFWARLMEGADPFRVPPRGRWNVANFESADPGACDKTYCSAIGIIDTAEETPDGLDMTVSWLRRAMQAALATVRVRPSDRFRYMLGYSPDTTQALETALIVDDVLNRLSDGIEVASPESAQRLKAQLTSAMHQRWPRGVRPPAALLPHRVLADSARGLLPEGTPAVIVDTACASGLHAVDLGVKNLLAGHCDVAVCAGAISIGPLVPVLFGSLGGLPKHGNCRPLDRDSEGVLFSDGAAVIVLKRIERARADGDRVLAVVKCIGSSSDGKGKAVYAPSKDGQLRAIQRCQNHPAFERHRLVWVVAHATGTSAGDVAELQALRQQMADKCLVTSNKAVFGHTGWAAGVVSVIHAVLGLKHGLVPAQPRFMAARPEAGLENSSLTVPKETTRLPSPESGPPLVAVSAFGFGGINGHMLLAADAPHIRPTPAPPRPSNSRIVIVAWAMHLPGLATSQAQSEWLRGQGQEPAVSFGETYPDPGAQLRLSGRTKRAIDRTQLMALECLPKVAEQLGAFWPSVTPRTGVFLGHLGKTGHGIAYGRRVYFDDVRKQLLAAFGDREPLLLNLLEHYGQQVRASIPASSEDSFPGIMPNIIAARLANVYDLHGPTMTLDAGFASTYAAIEVACQYLRMGDVDCAITGAVNGSSLPETRRMLHVLSGRSDLEPAEGVFLFALVREDTARAAQLKPIAYVENLTPGPQGTAAFEPGLHYLGAQGGVALARGLVRLASKSEKAHPIPVLDSDECGTVVGSFVLAPVEQPAVVPDGCTTEAAALPGESGACVPPAEKSPVNLVQRYVVELRAIDDEPSGESSVFFAPPTGTTIVLTDQPDLALELLQRAGNPPGVLVVSTAHADGVIVVPALDEASLDAVPEAFSAQVRHIRVVSNLVRVAPLATGSRDAAPMAVALHDLTFLALRRWFRQIDAQAGSFGGLLLGALCEGRPHPLAALHGGLWNSVAQEFGRTTRVFGVATEQTDPVAALAEADAETGLLRVLPMVYIFRGRRHAELPRRAEAPARAAVAPLAVGSTVVVIGGARGIAAKLSLAIANRFRPRLYILGRQPMPHLPSEVSAGSDETFLAGRRDFIARAVAVDPSRPVKDIIAEHERLYLSREAERNIAALAETIGPERVRYLRCDITNWEDVQAAFATIFAESGAIDLLVNAAGIDESQTVLQKSLASFRAVRDVKLIGYHNLKRMLAQRPPGGFWNIGSLTGVFGNQGQTDYASCNAYLAAAARLSAHEEEVTLAFSLWGDAGFITHPQRRDLAKVLKKRFTPMPTAEGIQHFLTELEADSRQPVVTWMGAIERDWVRSELRATPDYIQRNLPEVAADVPIGRGDFYLDACIEESPTRRVFSRVLDLARDAYLSEHLVSGHPTLPGTFVLEMAAEAAAPLAKGLHLIGFEDVSFEQFLRVYHADRPVEVRIIAERVPSIRSTETRVAVRIVSDVKAPSGVVLKRERPHFSLTACFADRFAAMPDASPLATVDHLAPAVDPYHVEGSPVRLSGVFVTTTDTAASAQRRRATYVPSVDLSHPVFRRFLLPVLMLDGLLRISILREGAELVVVAPRRIDSVYLFETCSDASLGAEGERLLLSSDGPAIDAGEAPTSLLEARRRDGRLLARMKGLTWVKLGTVSAPQSAKAAEGGRPAALTAAYAAYLEASMSTAPIDSFAKLLDSRNGPRKAFRAASYDYYFRAASNPRGAWIEVEGRRMLPLGSYSYLGLIGHPKIDAAAKAAIDRFGTGTHGARALAGSLTLHQELERRIAAFKGTEDAIVFTSGFTANVATISTLVGKGDWVICDTLDHASIVDGAQLSGARFVQFQHNSLSSLELRLKHSVGGRRLVVADAVFSMDGDIINLPDVAALCRRYDAWLMIDEAHSTGVLGQRGHGILEHFGMKQDSVQILMGTLSKTIPSVGGYVAARADVVEMLRNHARGFVFSAALPPPQAAAALAALDVIDSEPERVARLWANTRRYQEGLRRMGFDTLASCTPIVPIVGGSAEVTLEMARLCHEAGIFVPPVVYPVVPMRSPRLRSNMSAMYSNADVEYVLATLGQIGRRIGVIPAGGPIDAG